RFAALLGDPRALASWHLLFMALTVAISAAGLARGIELANKIMIPGLFALLIALVGYSFATGDMARGAPFIFRADWSQLDAAVVLAAVGQAFYRSEEHTSELQSRENLVCRLLLEKKNSTAISLN